MKKLLFILCISLLGLSSCYVDESLKPKEAYKVSVSDFVDLDLVINNAIVFIYVDKNTDVLYFMKNRGLSPIMKADGTCLTLTEWKEKRR